MEKVLILDGGATHAVAIAECLKRSGYAVAALCSNKYEYGYHSHFIDERYLGPDSHDKNYAYWVIRFLKGHKFDVLIPTSDATAEFMSFHKDTLTKLTGVLMPDKDIFKKAYDKNNLMRVCRENNFPHPLTIDLQGYSEVIDDIEELQNFPYPGLLKPNLTSGGRGMTLVNSIEELKQVYPSIRKQYGE